MFGPWELILILVIALIVFGPGRLPEMGEALGKGLKEFKKASNNIKDEVAQQINQEPEGEKAQ